MPRNLRSIAVYSLKGGVGKTTISVHLARAAASLSSRETLLWDLDPQAASSFLLDAADRDTAEAQAVFARKISPTKLIVPTSTERLALLPADASLRGLDRLLFGLGKKRRLEKLIESLSEEYERIILDCPPGLTETSEQVLRAADVIIVPLVPSPLSHRALDEVVAFLDHHQIRKGALLPVYNMVDRRRSLHLAALAANPTWPVIPMASAIEAQTAVPQVGKPIANPAASTVLEKLWMAIEARLLRPVKQL